MDVLILLVFASVVLLVASLLLLFKSVSQGDYEHGDRLSLLPLEEDGPIEPTASAPTTARTERRPER